MKYLSILLLSFSILTFIYLFFFTKDTNKVDEIIHIPIFVRIAGTILFFIFLHMRNMRKEVEKNTQ